MASCHQKMTLEVYPGPALRCCLATLDLFAEAMAEIPDDATRDALLDRCQYMGALIKATMYKSWAPKEVQN